MAMDPPDLAGAYIDGILKSEMPKEAKEFLGRHLQTPEDAFSKLTVSDGLELSKRISEPKFPTFDRLPCANIQLGPTAYSSVCNANGTSFCGKCKLVAYCSKECQTAHWKQHKPHCRDKMLSPDWRPRYEVDRRVPAFVQDRFAEKDRIGVGLPLWAKLPARDLVNLPRNENALDKDLNLAWTASGDLASVVKTVVDLPEGYTGKINILINDFHSIIFYRNILILLILTHIEDQRLAVDIALHLWYSISIPGEYRGHISSHVFKPVLELKARGFVSLGPTSKLSMLSSSEEWIILLQLFFGSQQSLTVYDVHTEYCKARWQASQEDHREHQYAQLRPSHRVAFQEYRQTGQLLPFGAGKAHFNFPNLSLFAPKGRWLLTDDANPLNGYDVKEVIDSGITHGCRMEDIYGCLHFHISDQLQAFARRIKTLNISFHLTQIPPQHLPDRIHHGNLSASGLHPTTRFDRIDVGDTLSDDQNIGFDSVLTKWKPFLAKTKHAAIVGCFSNWLNPENLTDDSPAWSWQPTNAEVSKAMSLSSIFAHQFDPQAKAWRAKALSDPSVAKLLMQRGMELSPLFLDNSRSLHVYLGAKQLDSILKRTRLVRRVKHKILPHRLGLEIDDPENATPRVRDGEDLYMMDTLTQYLWSERFVEFCHA